MSRDLVINDDELEISSSQLIQTPTLTQETDSTTILTPRLETPEADSLMTQFLTKAIINLTYLAPLPPNTPTRPKAMQNMSFTAASSTKKYKSPLRIDSQDQEFKFASSPRSGVVTPSPKRPTSWRGERKSTPSPESARRRKAAWKQDHWSPGSRSRTTLDGDYSRSGLKWLSTRERGACCGEVRRQGLINKTMSETTKEEHRVEGGKVESKKDQGQRDAKKDTKIKNLPVLPPKPVEPSQRKRKPPSLMSAAIAGRGLDTEEERKRVCYNCGKKDHWFIDCLVDCGHCSKDGHRTMDCSVIGTQSRAAARVAET